MKDFTRPRGRLRSLPVQARLVYSIFLAFTLVGLGFSVWLTQDMVGADLAELDAYYAGEASEPALAAPPSPAGGGPELDLPAEAIAAPVAEPMPLRKLLELTHFHLFSMPVYLMILSHLFMLSRMGEGAKALWIILGTLGVAAHMAAPWVARSGDGTLFYAASGITLGLSFLVMCVLPLWEMWAPAPAIKS